MKENKPNVGDFENEYDLSSMIDEYDEDQGLRQKIEQMKQAKAKEEQKQQDIAAVNVEDSALFVAKQNVVKPEKYSAHETMAEDDLGKTRVLPMGGAMDDGDKTLVIMDNQRAKAFQEKEKKVEEEEESIFVYDNRQVDEEEITEEDIQEFLGENPKKSKPPMDPNKVNKIITSVICGCIALVVLFAVGVGVKMLMDSNSDSSDKVEDKEPNTEPDVKDPVPDNTTDKPVAKDPVTTTPETPKTDNSIRIAEIKGEIKGLEANLTTFKDSLKVKTEKRDAAVKSASDVQGKISPIQTKVDNELKQDMEVKEKAYNELKAKVDAGDKTITEAKLTEAKTAMEKSQKAWNEQVEAITKLNAEKAVFDKEVASLNEEIASINAQVEECNASITALNTELSSLQ